MSFISKTAPVDLDPQGRCLVLVPPVGEAAPTVGDVIYVWFSEAQGGSGLAYRGAVIAVGDGVPLAVAVEVEATCKPGVVTKAHLKSYACAPAGSGEAGLWGKLYRHAHNKIVELNADEARFLDAYFS